MASSLEPCPSPAQQQQDWNMVLFLIAGAIDNRIRFSYNHAMPSVFAK
jgi:hypothetical protein